jgi:hypothetical protein
MVQYQVSIELDSKELVKYAVMKSLFVEGMFVWNSNVRNCTN